MWETAVSYSGCRDYCLDCRRSGIEDQRVRPVAQVKFTERTSDNQLRQPVFLGLRTDKQVKAVIREWIVNEVPAR
jgi:ATP-dependent DNA ligase